MRISSKIVLLFIMVFPVAFTSGCVYSTGGEKIIKVAGMPDTPEFKVEMKKNTGSGTESKHVDLGYKWSQTTFFWCPIINDKGTYVGYINSDKNFVDVGAGQLRRMADTAKIDLSVPPSLPFWDSVGGKLVGGVILLIIIAYFIISSAVRN